MWKNPLYCLYLQLTVAFMCHLSEYSLPSLQPALWVPYLPLICLLCTLFLFFISSAVSLFPTRATPAPRDLLQNDLSVKSDPFRLRRADFFFSCQSLVDGGQVTSWCPHHSPQQQEKVSLYLISNLRFCWHQPRRLQQQEFLITQISSLFEQWAIVGIFTESKMSLIWAF